MKYDIITIGSASRDMFLFLDKKDAPVIDNPVFDPKRKKLVALEFGAKIDVLKSEFCFGGGGMNTAITFSRMGFKTACVSSVGCDENGDMIEKVLKSENINTRFLKKEKSMLTAFSVLLVCGEKKKDRVVLASRGVGNLIDFPFNDKDAKSAYWYYSTAQSGPRWKKEVDEISKNAMENKIKWAWNPGFSQIKEGARTLSKYLSRCDVLIVNMDEAIEILGAGDDPKELCFGLLKLGTKSVIISHGPLGAYYADENFFKYAKANKKIKAKEPTGAGDAFGSGFVSGLMAYGGNIEKSLALGIKNSESVIQKTGAQSGILKSILK